MEDVRDVGVRADSPRVVVLRGGVRGSVVAEVRRDVQALVPGDGEHIRESSSAVDDLLAGYMYRII